MSVPTDTPSTDGAPEPEEVLTNVLADMFEPWEPASPRTIAFSKMLRAKLNERGIRLARVVPEGRQAQCPRCGSDRRSHRVKTTPRTHCGHEWHVEPAGVPALDDDTRREVEALIEQHQWAIDREHPCSGACLGCGAGVDESCDPDCGCDEGEMGCDTAQVLEQLGPLIRFASAYLGGTDGR